MKKLSKHNFYAIIVFFIVGITITNFTIQYFSIKHDVNNFFRTISSEDIDEITVITDRNKESKKIISDDNLIDSLMNTINDLNWTIKYSKRISADHYSTYDFSWSNSERKVLLILHGKSSIFINNYNIETKENKYFILNVKWDNDGYDKILEAVEGSR